MEISLFTSQGLLSIWSGLLGGSLQDYSHCPRLSIFGKVCTLPIFVCRFCSPDTTLVQEAFFAPSSLVLEVQDKYSSEAAGKRSLTA